jgi:hypothetical protein
MKSSPTSLDSETPIAASGGIAAPTLVEGDPYQRLDELMVVVEALCPTWPERKGTFEGAMFRL